MNAVSHNAFIAGPAQAAHAPSTTNARQFVDTIEHHTNRDQYNLATEAMESRDRQNIEYGKQLVTQPAMAATMTVFVSLLAALRGGQKIEAIKIVRNATGMGLKEAKDWVEGLPGAGSTSSVSGYQQDGYLVLRRSYGSDWSEEASHDDVTSADRSAEAEARSASPSAEVILVKVLGRTRPVFQRVA